MGNKKELAKKEKREMCIYTYIYIYDGKFLRRENSYCAIPLVYWEMYIYNYVHTYIQLDGCVFG